MIFKKNVQISDLANKLIHMEVMLNEKLNDIQTNLNNKLNDKLNDIQSNLNDKLNDKLNDIHSNLNDKLNVLENQSCNCKTDDIYILEQLNEKMNNVLNHHMEQSIKTEEKLMTITSKNNKELTNNILETKQELLETWKTSDLSLRTDLQTFLLGLQKDIIHNICSQTNLAIEQTKALKSSILLIGEQVNKFYYDNEIIKHQLLLEQDIRNYNDEIESIKLTANNLKNTIDDILKNYDFEI